MTVKKISAHHDVGKLTRSYRQGYQDGLGPQIHRRSPEMLGGAEHDLSKLDIERRDELRMLLAKLRISRRLRQGQLPETRELLLDTPVLWRSSPDLVPFHVFRAIPGRLDRLQHPLGRISIDVDLGCTIPLEIVDEGR